MSTDAILNCPGCFSLISSICQRHSEVDTQYRAVFVQNCVVDKSISVEPTQGPCLESSEFWHPVLCEICHTNLGVQDQNDIYHFFHILPSDV